MTSLLPSFHDQYIVGYQIASEKRQVSIGIRNRQTPEGEATQVIHFTGVWGYQFCNDAFGNIIEAFREVSLKEFFDLFGRQIAKSHSLAGAPGAWASDLSSAPIILNKKGVHAIILSSSYGLSGWILSEKVNVCTALQ